MRKCQLKRIMLVDNNPDDNFFHKRIIVRNDPSVEVLVMTGAAEALDWIKDREDLRNQPDLICLDINMPGMNGWDFIAEYERLGLDAVIALLTTSANPDDRAKALKSRFVSEFLTKPLSSEMLNNLREKYFNDQWE